MISELELIKSIVGELSGVGLGFGLAYVSYLLISKIAVCFCIGYSIKYVCDRVFKLKESGITKAEAEKIQRDAEREKISSEAEISRLKKEVESIYHKYKVMKESKDAL